MWRWKWRWTRLFGSVAVHVASVMLDRSHERRDEMRRDKMRLKERLRSLRAREVARFSSDYPEDDDG